MVVMVVVVTMMVPVREGGTCEHHQEQYCRKNFLHGSNPNTIPLPRNGADAVRVSEQERAGEATQENQTRAR